LGRVFHAPPNVLHYGRAGSGPVLEEGMFFTIEPMVNLGRPETKVLADDWTAVTRDKSLSAQFEHSVGVTATGCEIFTFSPAGKFHPTWGYPKLPGLARQRGDFDPCDLPILVPGFDVAAAFGPAKDTFPPAIGDAGLGQGDLVRLCHQVLRLRRAVGG
jgi:hypothetical protein